MPAYSFCLLDSAGMTHDYFVRSFSSDDDARESAGRMVTRSVGVEIWNGRRLVERLAARSDRSGEIPGQSWAARKSQHRPTTPVTEGAA
jgi:hypothetical protein